MGHEAPRLFIMHNMRDRTSVPASGELVTVTVRHVCLSLLCPFTWNTAINAAVGVKPRRINVKDYNQEYHTVQQSLQLPLHSRLVNRRVHVNDLNTVTHCLQLPHGFIARGDCTVILGKHWLPFLLDQAT